MKNMHNPLLAGEAVVSFQPEVTIETDMKSGIYYIPYNATAFPEDAEPFYDAYVKNPSQQTNYTVPYVLSRSPLQNSAYDAFVHETYTQVPDETRQALSDILSELVGEEDADPYQYIPRVLEYVSTSARYDLNTPAVPDEKILCRGSCTTAKPVTVCIMRLRRRFCCDVLAFRRVM
ncbi:MAG: hypothetical protein ACLU3I_14755 [Acutalibacteraceae bacterium]